MKLNNPFSEDVRLLFLYVYFCFRCGRSDRGIELNHITGRDSYSAFNACPLCPECHSHIGHTQQEERELWGYTYDFLLKEGYNPSDYDYDFLRNHPHLINEDKDI